jgi:hypothetical protein
MQCDVCGEDKPKVMTVHDERGRREVCVDCSLPRPDVSEPPTPESPSEEAG